jgi:CTP synthase
MVFSGVSPDYRLVEIIELPTSVHPYFIATQFHPEFKSRPNRAHPLFAGLVAAALKRRQEKEAKVAATVGEDLEPAVAA